MCTGFPRTSFCEDAYNQRQQTAAVSRRSVCSVGLGQRGNGGDCAGGRKLGPGLPGPGATATEMEWELCRLWKLK